MAELMLYRDETERDDLPDLCMACGQPATPFIRKLFSWFPPWVIVLIFAGLLPYAIVALILTKKMPVAVPVCDRHRGYWWKRVLVMVLPLIAIFGIAIATMVVLEDQQQGSGGFACLGGGIVLLAHVILIAIIQNRMIRPAEITDDAITLRNVDESFVQAFEQRGRRSRRRDFDEEFDDRPARPRRAPVDDEYRADREDRPRPPPDDRDTFRADRGDE